MVGYLLTTLLQIYCRAWRGTFFSRHSVY